MTGSWFTWFIWFVWLAFLLPLALVRGIPDRKDSVISMKFAHGRAQGNDTACRHLCVKALKESVRLKPCKEAKDKTKTDEWIICPQKIFNIEKGDTGLKSYSKPLYMVPLSSWSPSFVYFPQNGSLVEVKAVGGILSMSLLKKNRTLFVVTSKYRLCYFKVNTMTKRCLHPPKVHVVSVDNKNQLMFFTSKSSASVCLFRMLVTGLGKTSVHCWDERISFKSMVLDTMNKIVYIASESDIYNISYEGQGLTVIVERAFVMSMAYNSKLVYSSATTVFISQVPPYKLVAKLQFQETIFSVLISNGMLYLDYTSSGRLVIVNVTDPTKNETMQWKGKSINRHHMCEIDNL